LIVLPESETHRQFHVISNGLHLRLLHQGNECLWKGEYGKAEQLYLKSLNYLVGLPEAKLGLTLCNLFNGNANMALSWIEQPIFHVLEEYKAIDPDPVEWSYFIISLLCLGRLNDAFKLAEQFAWLHHPELDRTRWAINVLSQRGVCIPSQKDEGMKQRWTIHPLPNKSFNEWVRQLCIMLKACGQKTMADTMECTLSSEALPTKYQDSISDISKTILLRQERRPEVKSKEKKQYVFLSNLTSDFFKYRVLYGKTKSVSRVFVAGLLHRLEVKYGYFLPYHISEARNDDFLALIRKLAREENINTALIVGAVAGKGSTEAFLTGASENENRPSLFCVSASKRRFFGLKRTHINNLYAKWYELSPNPLKNSSNELDEALKNIKQDNKIVSFDALLIDNLIINYDLNDINGLSNLLHGALFIFLENINNIYNYRLHNRLFTDPTYEVVAHDPGLRNGYAIFKKR